MKLEIMTKDEKYLLSLGQKIADLRKAKGLTQEEFAKLTKMNRASLARLEREPINLTLKTIMKISKVLEIEFLSLLNLKD